MTHIEKCPVCNGKGIVPNGFYKTVRYEYTSTSTSTVLETCRSCLGTGIVTVQDNDFIDSKPIKENK